MIIQCINCNKKFDVDSSLIPIEGRNIQCGSCDHVWFFKPDESFELKSSKPIIVDQPLINNKKVENFLSKDKEDKNQKKKIGEKKTYELTKYKKKSSFTFGKLLSYIVVLTISFVALIILIDTFKTPLYSFFPNLESIIFSLFELLIDIKLFVKDLFNYD